jgi:hypothetical protein
MSRHRQEHVFKSSTLYPVMSEHERRDYDRILNERLAKGDSIRQAHAAAKRDLDLGKAQSAAREEDAQRQPARNAAAERAGRAVLAKYKF